MSFGSSHNRNHKYSNVILVYFYSHQNLVVMTQCIHLAVSVRLTTNVLDLINSYLNLPLSETSPCFMNFLPILQRSSILYYDPIRLIRPLNICNKAYLEVQKSTAEIVLVIKF